MTLATLTWFTLGAAAIYVVAVDPNVYDWLALQSKRLGLILERTWWMIRNHPDSPWVRYSINRRANKIAKEMLKDLQNDRNQQ